jgi:hypothetical protein
VCVCARALEDAALTVVMVTGPGGSNEDLPEDCVLTSKHVGENRM